MKKAVIAIAVFIWLTGCGCDLLVVDGWDLNPCFHDSSSLSTCWDLYDANSENFPSPTEWFTENGSE